MKMKTLARNVFPALLGATVLLTAASVLAQVPTVPQGPFEPRPRGGETLGSTVPACPRPITLTLNATPPNVFTGDFGAVALAAPRAGLNDAVANKFFLYTFQWKSEGKCCQITSAVLTVKMKANILGTAPPPTSSDAFNDTIAVVQMGTSERVYGSTSFPAGTLATKTWNLTGAVLNNINANNRLSFAVQDDTNVLSATLQLWGCCLTSGALP